LRCRRQQIDLFQAALGLVPPANFDAEKKRLDIEIDFKSGGRFPLPRLRQGKLPGARHRQEDLAPPGLLPAPGLPPRARRPHRLPDCGVRLVNVPWARLGSGFTLLFEAFVMTLVTAMPVAAAARLVGEHDTRLWRIVQHYVEKAVARMDLADLRRVAIDETAAKRGQDNISLFVDIDARKVVYVAEGNDAKTVARFADHVDDHNSCLSQSRKCAST
jgi:transposase